MAPFFVGFQGVAEHTWSRRAARVGGIGGGGCLRIFGLIDVANWLMNPTLGIGYKSTDVQRLQVNVAPTSACFTEAGIMIFTAYSLV
jgi:hypothetical protein